MIDDFLRRLSRVRKVSGGWMASCPAHEDSAPSLSVAEGGDGRVLVYCFAGCSLESITSALGMETRELFADESPVNSGCTLSALAVRTGLTVQQLESFGLVNDSHNGLPVVAIPYWDERSNLLRTKYRRRVAKGATGEERFTWGPGSGNYPYGLWRLKDAKERGGLVICEGESDTWSLWCEGIPALGIPGATQARMIQASHLAGIKRVWVARDNDPAGEEFASTVVKRLDELGFSEPARIVSAPRPHNDINDWRRSSGDTFRDEFRLATKKAPTIAETKSPLLWADRIPQRVTRFAFNPYIPKGYLTLLAGKPGMGKTMVACALIAAVTSGTPILGSFPERPGKAVLFSAEDDASQVLVPRLERADAQLDRVGIFDFDAEEFSLNGDGIKRLEMIIAAEQPELIVLDPLVTFLSAEVDINQANEVRAILRPLADLAHRTQTAILVIAHVKKGNSGDAVDSVVGSIDFMAAVRSAMRTYRDPERVRGKQQYVLGHIKHNLTAPGPGLRYEIRPSMENPLIPELLWLGRSRFTVDQLSSSDEDLDDIEEAVEFLRSEVAVAKPFRQVRSRARELGISDKPLQLARRRIGFTLDRRTDGLGQADWYVIPNYGDGL